MKKIILAIVILFCFNASFAQTDFSGVKLNEKADYKKAEPVVLEAVTYIFSTPYAKNDMRRLQALQLDIHWMTGTPDYNFSLDNAVSKITKGNDELMGYYMAALTKYCLESPSMAKDAEAVKLNAVKILLTYCANEKNNMKMTKQLKKLAEANEKGELEKEL